MTKLEEFVSLLHDISHGVSELRERMARVEEKVDGLKAHAKDGKETDKDHETRLRSLELAKAKLMGGAAAAGAAASFAAQWMLKKIGH